MATLVQNQSQAPFSFPAPWKGVLNPGEAVVLNKTVEEVQAVVGVIHPSLLKVLYTPQSEGFDDARVIPAAGDAVDGSINAADLASNSVTTAKIVDANVTTAKIADANVTAAKLAPDANMAALVAAGLGASGEVDHADATPVELLAADADDARACLLILRCTESLAGDNAPTFQFGYATALEAAFASATLAGAVAGDVFTSAFNLPATRALVATLGTGGSTTNDAGKFAWTLLALPAAA